MHEDEPGNHDECPGARGGRNQVAREARSRRHRRSPPPATRSAPGTKAVNAVKDKLSAPKDEGPKVERPAGYDHD